MSRIRVTVSEAMLQGDYTEVEGVEVCCEKCDHVVEVFGTSGASVRRGCAMLRDECPRGEENFYVDDEAD